MDVYGEILAWRGRICAALAFLCLVAVSFLAWPPASELDEPSATASFLAAYARADEATAERVASPLYRDEWARWGLTPRDRVDLAPRRTMADGRPAPWIDFTFQGGAHDGHGFQHLLYAAYPACDFDCRGPAVWRVDTEADGRVIWAEMVWMFSPEVDNLVTSSDPKDLPPGMNSLVIAANRAQLAVAVRSSTGPEGYYELTMGDAARTVVFFAVGGDGDLRPGAWSYGRTNPAIAEYGVASATPNQRLPKGDESLRQSYMMSLP